MAATDPAAAMVRRMARRIVRESKRPGRKRFTYEEAVRIATGRLREYGYVRQDRVVLTRRGARYEQDR